MSRGRVWHGLRDWWRPGPASDAAVSGAETGPASGPADAVDEPASTEDGPAWQIRELAARAAAEASMDDADVSEEDLLEFLAGDIDPVEADPAFKRRLREQLWSLIRENELTRQ